MLKRAHALSAVVAQICTRAVFIRIYLITDGISGQRQRVTWGHNISCRGIPPPFIPLPTSHLLTKTKMQVRHHKCALSHFSTPSSWNDWQTNGWMDRQTDKASYRVVCRLVISNRDTIGKWHKWLNVSCLGVKFFFLSFYAVPCFHSFAMSCLLHFYKRDVRPSIGIPSDTSCPIELFNQYSYQVK